MPVTGEVKTNPGKLEEPDKGFRSRFDKKDETARPGYYSVLLKDYQVKAELTATARVGLPALYIPGIGEPHMLFISAIVRAKVELCVSVHQTGRWKYY